MKTVISMAFTIAAVIFGLVIYKKMEEYKAKKDAERKAMLQAQINASNPAPAPAPAPESLGVVGV
jgi:hypothetical protein